MVHHDIVKILLTWRYTTIIHLLTQSLYIFKGGSLGKGTAVRGRSDVDLLVVLVTSRPQTKTNRKHIGGEK
jgi:tRNA nucleotidyltransferase (CCA-adding enzyme)